MMLTMMEEELLLSSVLLWRTLWTWTLWREGVMVLLSVLWMMMKEELVMELIESWGWVEKCFCWVARVWS